MKLDQMEVLSNGLSVYCHTLATQVFRLDDATRNVYFADSDSGIAISLLLNQLIPEPEFSFFNPFYRIL